MSFRRNTMEFKEPIKLPDYVLVGDEYLTLGGWKARVVYITANRYYFYAIHRPDTKEESSPETHRGDGECSWYFGPDRSKVLYNYNILLDKKVSN